MLKACLIQLVNAPRRASVIRIPCKFLALWCVVAASIVRADEITIAVAANFATPMEAICQRFEQDTGHKVHLAVGSSGKFFAQIEHGAPFQAFFSADQAKPAQLERNGLTVPNSRFTYARGRLVLWSAAPEAVDATGNALKRGTYHKLAIANPKLAPYGAAAVETLKNLGLESSARKHLVQGENIAQTFQFVASGNAELGLVALSQVMRNGEIGSGSAWLVPETLYSPILQDAVILVPGRNSAALASFWEFVQSKPAQRIIESYGYASPHSAAQAR
ncbi:molybdate ABC transporter substrate-binding protein [Microbulbifer aggregans]|uniref:molybdate ABC transporter substrate-binding protein n=1 Tax=Microbulbifer aggregans TaxID=1769779 RepID=UPI001CFE699A|nr:molybdate ABC transporter substrate-binding protein [Microbulbifer aggregans]